RSSSPIKKRNTDLRQRAVRSKRADGLVHRVVAHARRAAHLLTGSGFGAARDTGEVIVRTEIDDCSAEALEHRAARSRIEKHIGDERIESCDVIADQRI